MPVLILHQREDPVENFEGAMRLAALLPDASMRPLEGRDHVFRQGQPQIDVVGRAVESFILGREKSVVEGGTSTRTQVTGFAPTRVGTSSWLASTIRTRDAPRVSSLRGQLVL